MCCVAISHFSTRAHTQHSRSLAAQALLMNFLEPRKWNKIILQFFSVYNHTIARRCFFFPSPFNVLHQPDRRNTSIFPQWISTHSQGLSLELNWTRGVVALTVNTLLKLKPRREEHRLNYHNGFRFCTLTRTRIRDLRLPRDQMDFKTFGRTHAKNKWMADRPNDSDDKSQMSQLSFLFLFLL